MHKDTAIMQCIESYRLFIIFMRLFKVKSHSDVPSYKIVIILIVCIYYILKLILMIVHNHSINLMTCELSTRVSTVVEAVKHVIRMVKTTGRRSVLAAPLFGGKSQTLNDAVEEATKENITVVTSAGKK